MELTRNNIVRSIEKEQHRFLFHNQSKFLNVLVVGVAGDCITLVSKILNINAYESAKQINDIFSLGVDFGQPTSNFELNRYKQIQQAKEEFKRWHNKTLQMLCDYLHSLKGIKKLQKQEMVEYYIDLLIFGSEKDCLWFKKTEERWCREVGERYRTKNINR